MSKLFLKVKIKSLAAEARIIRLEERRRKAPFVDRQRFHNAGPPSRGERIVLTKRGTYQISHGLPLRFRREWSIEEDDVYFSLHHHRTVDIRREARAAQLAYAFIRHHDYRSVEASRKDVGFPADILARIAELAAKYGDTGKSKNDLYAVVHSWLRE